MQSTFRVLLIAISLIPAFLQPAQAAEFDPISSGLRMLTGLLVVLAIILGLFLLLRKRLSSFQQQGGGLINVLEIKHVLPRKTLMLVEVRGREFLVGAGADSIQTIVPVQQGESFAELLEKSQAKKS